MPSPAVASSASPRPELWRSQPAPAIPLSRDRWDEQFLTQALSNPSTSTRQSLARALSHCLAGSASWQTSEAQKYACSARASQQQPDGDFSQQKKQQCEVDKLDAASSMSTSDGSPLSSPPGANSNSSAGGLFGESKPHDATASLSGPENGNALGIHVENALRAAAMGYTARSVKFEGEGHGQTVISNSTAKATPAALSAHAALGSGVTKVSKRRSRATSKVPTTVLSADASNFRAMVQKLTGIQVSTAIQSNRFPFWNQDSVLKPHPTRPSQSIQGLPTLDTSACLLVDGGSTGIYPHSSNSSDNVLQNFHTASFLKPFLQQADSSFKSNFEFGLPRTGVDANQSRVPLGATLDFKPPHANLLGNSSTSTASLPGIWDVDRTHACNGFVPGADLFNSKHTSGLDNLMTGNDIAEYDGSGRSFHSIDSWFSSDIALPKKAELARTV